MVNIIRRVITICIFAAFGIIHFAAAYSPITDGAMADVRIKAVTNEVYDKTIVYNVDRRSGKLDVVDLPLDDEFFTFRMRTVTNEVGEVVQAYYGRIAERSGHMFGLWMKTWFNTKPNDTNLEDARVR